LGLQAQAGGKEIEYLTAALSHRHPGANEEKSSNNNTAKH
jgi:hypothetical protein